MMHVNLPRVLQTVVLLSILAQPVAAHDAPGTQPPQLSCQLDAFVTAGPIPRVGDFIAIGAFTHVRSSMRAFTFDVLCSTRLRSSCDSTSLPGPVIATHAVPVGSTYEITSAAGVCLTLCRCD